MRVDRERDAIEREFGGPVPDWYADAVGAEFDLPEDELEDMTIIELEEIHEDLD